MTRLEPPVHPFSDVDEIRRWIARLHDLLVEHPDDPADRALIRERIREAQCWLEFRGYDRRDGERRSW